MQITIHLPEASQCILKSGQDVDFGTPYLKKKIKNDVTYPLAQKLQVPSEKIFHYLKKFVGDPIKKGDILAVKKGLLSTKKLLSEYEGVLKEVNHSDGSIVITESKEDKDTSPAYFKGHVVEVEKTKLVLKLKTGKEYPIKKADVDFGGEVFYLNDHSLNFSSADVGNKVIITETLSEYLETKLEALNIQAFVTLNKLSDGVAVPTVLIKSIDDFKKIQKESFAYCFIDNASSRIIFYN